MQKELWCVILVSVVAIGSGSRSAKLMQIYAVRS
jgi:hypothetical protein